MSNFLLFLLVAAAAAAAAATATAAAAAAAGIAGVTFTGRTFAFRRIGESFKSRTRSFENSILNQPPVAW